MEKSQPSTTFPKKKKSRPPTCVLVKEEKDNISVIKRVREREFDINFDNKFEMIGF